MPRPKLKIFQTTIPPDWESLIDTHLSTTNETRAEFIRIAMIRELRRRKVDVSGLSEVRGPGNPRRKGEKERGEGKP